MRGLLNWRYYVITALFGLGMCLLCSDYEDEALWWVSKFIAAACIYAFYRLVKRWDNSGKIEELSKLKIE